MIHARISYFHTIQSILKHSTALSIPSWPVPFPYYSVYFKADLIHRAREVERMVGFPYYSVYFKAEPIILFLG